MFLRLLLILFAVCFSFNALALETKARNVVLMDCETGDYLFTKDSQVMVPPASMSKLMTVYIIFSKLKDGSLKLDDTFSVSENAWRKGGAASGGSTMFLKLNSEVKVEDLLHGIIIQSGNDACIVAAENIAGSEENFAAEMNDTAKKLGLNNSHFENATGLPHPDHRMSVEDLAKLAQIIINDFPEYYNLFSQKSFTYNGIVQGNRNPLLYSMPDADGLKTGHTEEAGYSLTCSVKKGDRRLIGVMTGMESNKDRGEEANMLMNWGFREFDNYTVLKQGTKVATTKVFLGEEKEVDLLVGETVRKSLQKSKVRDIKMTAVYDEPIKAPVKKGSVLGHIVIEIPENEPQQVPLLAGSDVAEMGFAGKFMANLKYILFGIK